MRIPFRGGPTPATGVPQLTGKAATVTAAHPVDGHVHIHPVHDPAALLDAAWQNLQRAAAGAGLASRPGYLLLTESAGTDAFDALRGVQAGRWRMEATGDALALRAVADRGNRLYLVAGRQLVTSDGLELLALCSRFHPPDRSLTLEGAIQAVQARGGLPVIPWGFGKWTLRRRRVVEEAMAQAARPLFLGDNGGRWRGLPAPRLLAAAAGAGIPVLPGSDPLPFRAHQRRPGSAGFLADFAADDAHPATGLAAWLRQLRSQPVVFGDGTGLVPFALDQVRMQLRRRGFSR
jgi:hypothetical protein